MARRLRWSLSILGLLLVFAFAAAAYNIVYLQRVITFFGQDQVRGVDWFSPTAELRPSPAPLAITQSTGSTDFAEALSYAESTNTSALLIWHQGNLRLAHYGDGYSAADYVQTNSIHKSILALMVGIAIRDGAIGSVEDPISDYLPGWHDEVGKPISIEHLLTMSSGLVAPGSAFELFSHSMRLLHSPDIAGVARESLQMRTPGVRFDYANTNAQLLLEVLERATEQDYEHYLAEKLWSKLAEHPGHLWLDREKGTPHGFCCLISRPEDLLRLGIMWLQKGLVGTEQVVPSRWISAMQQPSALNPNYGYLTWLGSPFRKKRGYSADSDFGALHSEAFLVDDVVFFDGFGGQRLYIIPSVQLVIVRVGEARFDFDDSILPNSVLRALKLNAPTVQTPEATERRTPDVDVRYADLRIEAAHAKTIDVRVAYPESAVGSHPLIVFSHGNGLSNDRYDALFKGWVRGGYVVAAPRHLDTGSREQIDALTARVGRDWVTNSRALDVSAVITQMPSIASDLPDFEGRVDATKVIAAGHSFGAYTAQLLGGALYEVTGDSIHPLPSTLRDSRVAAVVALSSPGVIPGFLTQIAWQNFSTPQLVITGTRDTFDFLWPDYSAHFVAFDVAQAGHNHLLVVDGMDHYMGNLIGRLDRADAPQMLALATVDGFTREFMQHYLENGPVQGSVEAMQRLAAGQAHTNVARFDHR